MAQFKIELLTSIMTESQTYYLSNVLANISPDYLGAANTQKDSNGAEPFAAHSFAFTSNEKFSLHTNAQKDLSFDMSQKIWNGDAWDDNPYVANVQIGSQILLTDWYGDQHLFTVVDIQIKFDSLNSTYSYKCQDSFNYQLSRQNEGYTINNDPESSDFIGAKNVDWWIVNKILPECYISYNYIPLGCGLGIDNQEQFCLFVDDSSNSYYSLPAKKLLNVISVLKEPLLDTFFYETIPFSCSGSTAANALISLAEILSCSINVIEHTYPVLVNGQPTGQIGLYRYFYLAPTKNNNFSGLKYTPDKDVENYNISLKGNALTSVLNIKTHTINDEEIGLLPAPSGFFMNLFGSSDWPLMTEYYNGMFADILQGKHYRINATETSDKTIDGKTDRHKFIITIDPDDNQLIDHDSIPTDQEQVFLAIGVENFFDSPHYNKISFKDQGLYSYLSDSIQSNRYPFSLMIVRNDGYVMQVVGEEQEILSNVLSRAWQEKNTQCFLGCWVPVDIELDLNSSLFDFFIHLYRDFSEEDQLFAEAADKCPWLENKLINFNYFVQNNLLSGEEYRALMSVLQNDLRIINGQLLFYSSSYYWAIHQKTKVLADIANKLDMLGATCNADLIAPYIEYGEIKDYKSFDSAYRAIFQASTSSPLGLIGYEKELTESFNNYFSSEQRFLKNIYKFNEYFNTYSSIAYLGEAKLTINRPSIGANATAHFLTFDNSRFSSAYNSNDLKPELYIKDQLASPLFLYEGKGYRPVTVVNKTNCTQFYTADIRKGQITQITSEYPEMYKYNANYKFLLKLEDYLILFVPSLATSSAIVVTTNTDPWVNSTITIGGRDKTQDVLGKIGKERRYSGDFMIKNSDDIEVKETRLFVKMTTVEMARLYLYHHPDQFYVKRPSRYIPLDWIRFSSSNDVFRGINTDVITLPVEAAAEDGIPTPEEKWQAYRSNFALDYIYYLGPVYRVNSPSAENSKYTFDRLNEYNYTQTEYGEQQTANPDSAGTSPDSYKDFQSIPFVNHTPGYANNFNNLDLDNYLKAASDYKKDFNYFSFVENKVLKAAGQALTFLGSTPFAWFNKLLWWTVPAGTALIEASEEEKNCYWTKNIDSFRTFEPTIDSSTGLWSHAKREDETENLGPYDSIKAFYAQSKDSMQLNQTYSLDDAAKFINNNSLVKEYCNYYSLIAATYSMERNESRANAAYDINDKPQNYKFWVKNQRYYRFVDSSEKLSPTSNYKILVLHRMVKTTPVTASDIVQSREKWLMFNTTEVPNFDPFGTDDSDIRSFNGTQFYFLQANMTPFDMQGFDETYFDDNGLFNTSKLFGTEAGDYAQIQGLSGLSVTNEFDQYIYYTIFNKSFLNFSISIATIFCLVQEEDFERGIVSRDATQYTNWLDYKVNYKEVDLNEVYNTSNDSPMTLISQTDLFEPVTDGYPIFFLASDDEDFRQCTIDDYEFKIPTEGESLSDSDIWEENESNYFFKKLDDNSYERAYTVNQIRFARRTDQYKYDIPNTSYCCLNGSEYTQTNFAEDVLSYRLPMYLTTFKTDDVAQISALSSVKYPSLVEITFENVSDTQKVSVEYEGITYEADITLQPFVDIINADKQMTNGELWYRYNGHTEMPTLFETCASIEVQLTEYWTSAYSASRFCKFFLPDTWTPQFNDKENHFFHDIILPIYKKVNNTDVLDKVKLSNKFIPTVHIYKDWYEGQYTNWLPRYQVEFRATPSAALTFTQQLLPTPTISSAVTLFTNNDAYRQVAEHLRNNLSLRDFAQQFNVESAGKQVYYVWDAGGVTWSHMLETITNDGRFVYGNYDGWYGMQYYILSQQYSSLTLYNYDELTARKQNLWASLIQKYPGVLLEKVYGNEEAINSEELYKLASLELQQLTNPERSYSITISDIWKLRGYEGQHLHIGDPILIDVTHYFSDNSVLSQLVSEFLYISDINYTLRQYNGLGLTVNNLKYNEKLFQQLVKLI